MDVAWHSKIMVGLLFCQKMKVQVRREYISDRKLVSCLRATALGSRDTLTISGQRSLCNSYLPFLIQMHTVGEVTWAAKGVSTFEAGR